MSKITNPQPKSPWEAIRSQYSDTWSSSPPIPPSQTTLSPSPTIYSHCPNPKQSLTQQTKQKLNTHKCKLKFQTHFGVFSEEAPSGFLEKKKRKTKPNNSFPWNPMITPTIHAYIYMIEIERIWNYRIGRLERTVATGGRCLETRGLEVEGWMESLFPIRELTKLLWGLRHHGRVREEEEEEESEVSRWQDWEIGSAERVWEAISVCSLWNEKKKQRSLSSRYGLQREFECDWVFGIFFFRFLFILAGFGFMSWSVGASKYR